MTTKFKLAIALLAALAVYRVGGPVSLAAQSKASSSSTSSTSSKDGWIQLFDGKDLKGWRGYKKTDTSGMRWIVQDGMLTLKPSGAGDTHGSQDLITDDTFDQFDLRWEWKIAQAGNSGVKYFVVEDRNDAIGHEYQMIDDERHPDAKIGPHRQTAAFYDVFAAHDRPMKPAGEWNTSEVIVKGKHVTHILNGKTVLEYDMESPELDAAIAKSKFKGIERFSKVLPGHILVQDHGDQVWFRKIEIKRLK